MNRILIATEGSPCSVESIAQFVRLFDLSAAELYLVSVIPALAGPRSPETASQLNRSAEEALEALDGALWELSSTGLRGQGIVKVGEPAAAILAAAEELEVDLIVLGTHHHGGPGSIAGTVLHGARCGVMIFPQAEPAPRVALA